MLLEPPTDTLPRYRGSVANRALRPPIRPRRVSAWSHWWLDSGRMRSLTDGVCIKLLTRLRHNHKCPLSPAAFSELPLIENGKDQEQACRIMRQQNDQNSPTKKSSAPAAAQIAPFLMADGATLNFVAREDGKVRGSPSWHKTVVPFASGQFYTDSGRLTDALCPCPSRCRKAAGFLKLTKTGPHPVVRCTRNEARQEQGRQVR